LCCFFVLQEEKQDKRFVSFSALSENGPDIAWPCAGVLRQAGQDRADGTGDVLDQGAGSRSGAVSNLSSTRSAVNLSPMALDCWSRDGDEGGRDRSGDCGRETKGNEESRLWKHVGLSSRGPCCLAQNMPHDRDQTPPRREHFLRPDRAQSRNRLQVFAPCMVQRSTTTDGCSHRTAI
jgi:hypothetical protein